MTILKRSFSRQEIRDLFKTARTLLTLPSLEIRRGPEKDGAGRMLIVIPRRVGNAVRRNKIKRRVREIIKNLELKSDYIFLAKSPDLTLLSFEELKGLIDQALAK